MICQKCGKALPDGMKCSGIAAGKIRCNVCGAECGSDMVYCNCCGSKLSANSKPVSEPAQSDTNSENQVGFDAGVFDDIFGGIFEDIFKDRNIPAMQQKDKKNIPTSVTYHDIQMNRQNKGQSISPFLGIGDMILEKDGLKLQYWRISAVNSLFNASNGPLRSVKHTPQNAQTLLILWSGMKQLELMGNGKVIKLTMKDDTCFYFRTPGSVSAKPIFESLTEFSGMTLQFKK